MVEYISTVVRVGYFVFVLLLPWLQGLRRNLASEILSGLRLWGQMRGSDWPEAVWLLDLRVHSQ